MGQNVVLWQTKNSKSMVNDVSDASTRSTHDLAHHQFAHWTFDPDRGDLHDGHTTTRLEPQVAKLLHHFLVHQNIVISRDELIADVWNNRTVSDDAIGRCVSILRQILTPHDKDAYVETFRRRGYLAHFPAADSVPETNTPANQGRVSLKFMTIASIMLVSIAAIFFFSLFDKSKNPTHAVASQPPMVAVLPFSTTSQSNDTKFFAHGVQDDLLTQLAKLQGLRVISSTSVREYEDSPHNIRQIGTELGADAILEGSVQISANRIRINAQLIDAQADQHLWAETYDRDLTPVNLFDIQSEIARAIAEAMHASLTPQEHTQLALIPTQNMRAYRAYHRAMQMKAKPGPGNFMEQPAYREALEEAVALDSSFAMALAELASVRAYLNTRGAHPEFRRLAEQTLQQLQAVAPGSADHLFGQAGYVYYVLRDYDQAHDIISQAIEVNPSNVHAISLRSWIERRQGDWDAYVRSAQETRRLDPRNPHWKHLMLNRLVATHRYDEAQAELNKAPLNNFATKYYRHLLALRESRDFERYQQSMIQVCQFYERPHCGWLAHIANRDYEGAQNTLWKIEDHTGQFVLSDTQQRQILNYWLVGNDRLIQEGLAEWQSKVNGYRDENGIHYVSHIYIDEAMLAGITGDAEEAERLIQRFFRQQPVDLADQMRYWHEACQILGMIGATDAAVTCIREGLEQPSLVMPFLEPYLPYYDSIRDQQAFIELLSEIDEKRSPTARK